MARSHYIDLIRVLTHKEMKLRYRNSYLGYLWSILHPLAFAFVFFLAFKVVMRIEMEDYALFLIAGLFPWQWFSNSVNFSPNLLLHNAGIIKKVNFPRDTLPFSMVLQDMIHFVISIFVIVFFLFLYGKTPSLSWIYGVPLLLTVQFLITYGVALMVSSLNVFFRDLERLVGLGVTLLFYCTPIIYPETMVPEQYRYLLNLNPMSSLMVSWRNLFLDGVIEPQSLAISAGYGIAVFFTGYRIFRKISWRFAEIL